MLTHQYDLDQAKVQFKDIAPGDIPQALKLKQVHALLIVTPISEKYLAMLRDLAPRASKQQLRAASDRVAGAIAALPKAYESYELPKGTIRGSPPIPDEDLTTLRIPFYLVANSKVDNDAVTTLTKGVMDTRRKLASQHRSSRKSVRRARTRMHTFPSIRARRLISTASRKVSLTNTAISSFTDRCCLAP